MKVRFPERPRAKFECSLPGAGLCGSGLGVRRSWVAPGAWQDGLGASAPFLSLCSLQNMEGTS